MLNKGVPSVLRKTSWLLAPLSALIVPIAAQAQTSTLDWGAGDATSIDANATNIYDVGSGKVNINFANPENFTGFGGASSTPAINTILNGANADSDPSLHLQINPSGELGSVTMQTTFTEFAKPFLDVSFTLYDIDISGVSSWQDSVRLVGFGENGTTILPTFNILGSTPQQIGADTLVGESPANNDEATGNVEVSFKGIDGFDLTFADGPALSLADQNSHGIGVGDIEVTAVPEPMSALAVVAFGAVAAGSALKKKKQSV